MKAIPENRALCTRKTLKDLHQTMSALITNGKFEYSTDVLKIAYVEHTDDYRWSAYAIKSTAEGYLLTMAKNEKGKIGFVAWTRLEDGNYRMMHELELINASTVYEY